MKKSKEIYDYLPFTIKKIVKYGKMNPIFGEILRRIEERKLSNESILENHGEEKLTTKRLKRGYTLLHELAVRAIWASWRTCKENPFYEGKKQF